MLLILELNHIKIKNIKMENIKMRLSVITLKRKQKE